MTYKGYEGMVEFDEDARIFHGEVINTRDVITFQGSSVDELEKAFKDSVDDYLRLCEKQNRKPERPFSGRLLIRMDVELHSKLFRAAASKGKSLNTYIINKLRAGKST